MDNSHKDLGAFALFLVSLLRACSASRSSSLCSLLIYDLLIAYVCTENV